MSGGNTSSRERVLTAVGHKQPDRVPADGFFRPEVWAGLKRHFGVQDKGAVRQRLGLDIVRASIEPSNNFRERARPSMRTVVGLGSGSRQWLIPHEGNVFEDEWGVRKYVPPGGAYFSYVYHPLAEAESASEYDFPNVEAVERYENVIEIARLWRATYPIMVELSNFFKSAWELRGFARLLLDFYDRPAFVEALLDRIYEFRCTEALHLARLGVDIISLAGDVASQQGMMMSPGTWRRFFKPRLKALIERVREEHPEVKFFFHSDGDVMDIIGDVAVIGFDIIDPVQPECMDPGLIKRLYGDRLTLHAPSRRSRHYLLAHPMMCALKWPPECGSAAMVAA